MRFTPTELDGAVIVDIEPHRDERGFFARAFCAREFADAGLKSVGAQSNLSFNHRAGTLRGMHFQWPPVTETKLVRCLSGAILDVIVDLRPESTTFGRHQAVELSAHNWRALYVPDRFAHGYQTLTDDAEVMYQVSEFYTPGAEGGLRFNDPELRISWPLPVSAISDKDAAWPLLADGARAEIMTRMASESSAETAAPNQERPR